VFAIMQPGSEKESQAKIKRYMTIMDSMTGAWSTQTWLDHAVTVIHFLHARLTVPQHSHGTPLAIQFAPIRRQAACGHPDAHLGSASRGRSLGCRHLMRLFFISILKCRQGAGQQQH
jgi:hypothetical protein